ncbi:beta-glucosidase BglX [Ancylomarina sp. 16SWW S1-10-2]|uniref:beta-glucosidase BglX n=1 Tax=Ancylomarina sp. 16SWW S1-10-2 TaxID=2499681 RepID=UPI0012AD3E3D|nr:beta-glucosidase BglX [Ancylomarina sp. 16SWW S1-10-2]MRT93968.1 beta-glucosidase BglX [Ancylomarina sp. 16SWW S1-10-2]
MRIYTYLAFVCLLLLSSCAKQNDSGSKEDQFVNDLMAKMTLQEKIGQMNQRTSQWEMTGPAPDKENTQNLQEEIKNGRVGSMLNVKGAKATYEAQKLAVENSRLGIPMLFAYDVIHGYKTMFPIPLAEASSWDTDMLKLSAQVAAKEASASGLHWVFAPMMDVGRDARWGRVMEGCGEDPYLASIFSVARVRGFQGADLSKDYTVAACAKHFAAYAFSESGRDYNTVDIGTYTLHNIVLPPFKAVAESGVATFMNSFNLINGSPASTNAYLQRDLLKGDWGFDGFVVSDWGSIEEVAYHGGAKDLKQAGELCINAGSDMDMENDAYLPYLEELVNEGKVAESLIDDAVRRILKIKYKLGLFDDPYRYSNIEREKELVYNKENRAAAREVAKRSMVLLKNENQLLPISKNVKSLAVIGPLADSKDIPLGSWRAQAITNSAVSLLEGITNALPKTKINYAKGCDLTIGERNFRVELTYGKNNQSGFSKAIKAAKQSEVVVLAIGEDCFQTGEGRSQTDIRLKGDQMALFNAVYKVNKNIVVVLMNGRPVAIPELAEKAPAILETWFAGSEAGNAIADVLFGDYNPSGKLTMSFPRNVGQCPIYYNHMSTGRSLSSGNVFWSHYTDSPNTPLYPFGYGLSYTKFKYSTPILNKTSIGKAESIELSVNVSNAGNLEGEEVIQVYIQDPAAKYVRPVKELKAYKKVKLAVGEQQTVKFELSKKDLGYYSPDGEFLLESGTFHIFVGTDSQNVQKVSFTVKD